MPNKKEPWLKPEPETEEQKAMRKRLAKEKHLSPADIEAQLEAAQAKAKEPKPAPSKAPEPKPMWPDFEPTPNAPLDSRLVEIVRAWPSLGDRDREELVMMLRVKVHLNKKAPGQ